MYMCIYLYSVRAFRWVSVDISLLTLHLSLYQIPPNTPDTRRERYQAHVQSLKFEERDLEVARRAADALMESFNATTDVTETDYIVKVCG